MTNDLACYRPAPSWRRLVGCLLLGVLAAGCPEPKADPEDAFRRFLSDVHAHRAEAVWGQLSEATRKALLTRHQALRAAVGRDAGHEAEPPVAQILFEELGLTELNPPESIAVVSPPGQDVTLRVAVKDGKSVQVRMVREGQPWKVDLMRALAPAPPLDAELRGPETNTATVP